MELIVVKILSALVLWILSLCFGLMIPYLMWKARAGYDVPPCQNDHVTLETESLISDEDDPMRYGTLTRTPISCWTSFKGFFKRCWGGLCKYDITSFVNCCCGGLFLGICFLELLPESRQGVQNVLQKADIHTTLPVTEFFISIGLLLIMLIEQIVNALYTRQRKSRSVSYDVVHEETANGDSQVQYSETTSSSSVINLGDPSEEVVVQNLPCTSRNENPQGVATTSDATRSIVLIGMLSIHSIFEGLALGLEATVAHLIQLLVAISVHKSVLAFGIGMKLFETFAPGHVATALVCGLIFCSGSPLGCAVGLLMSPQSNTTDSITTSPTTTTTHIPDYFLSFQQENWSKVPGTLYATALLECLACGTFLYVTFVEVIPMEFSHSSESDVANPGKDPSHRTTRHAAKEPIKRGVKFLALVLGFALVTGLQFI